MPTLSIDINNGTSERAFAYKDREDLPFSQGPTVGLHRIIGAVAYHGERLPFQLPSVQPNISYYMESIVPLVRCDAASITDQRRFSLSIKNDTYQILTLNRTNDSMKWYATNSASAIGYWRGEIGYLALIEVLGNPSTSAPQYPNHTYVDRILFAIQKNPTTSDYKSDTEYLACELWNASLSFRVHARAGTPEITQITPYWLKRVSSASLANSTIIDGRLNTLSYLSYFNGLAQFMSGAVYWQTAGGNRSRSEGRIGQTNLALGSQFYDMSLYMATMANLSGQIAGKDLVRNASFRDDVEAFALNVSLSFLNDPAMW